MKSWWFFFSLHKFNFHSEKKPPRVFTRYLLSHVVQHEVKLQEDEFALVDDEECSNRSIVSEADITRELELFRQQWYNEIRAQAEKSSDASTRSKVCQLVVTREPSDEDQVR